VSESLAELVASIDSLPVAPCEFAVADLPLPDQGIDVTAVRALCATASAFLAALDETDVVVDRCVQSLAALEAEGSLLDDVRARKITPCMHASYRLMTRLDTRAGTRLHRCRRLFQQLCVDLAAQMESNRLSWLRHNQDKLRADSYKGLADALRRDDVLNDTGKKVILPSSYVGSDRYMQQLFQDGMAVVRSHGKPHLFVTVTCNPKWDEITREVELTGGTVEDRPDIVARVFRLKLKAIEADLYKNGVFGRSVAHLRVVEFQKRGLPHAHILLILEKPDAPQSPDDWGQFVQAELPDEKLHPTLFGLLTGSNKHGPCSTKPCGKAMVNGCCAKHYPMPFRNVNTRGPFDRPEYKRRDAKNGGHDDNNMIVPFNWVLSWRYRCHINVEVCSSVSSVKYLYKYVTKGHDRVAASIRTEKGADQDEIKNYLDARYMGASEGVYRLFKFDLSSKYPSVERLGVHLPEGQLVYFDPSDSKRARTKVSPFTERDTTLTGWFKANKLMREKTNAGGVVDPLLEATYADFPKRWVWNGKHWQERIHQKDTKIGRMYMVSPKEGERFYLRTLLTVRKDVTSWTELKQGPTGEVCEDFKHAAIAWGLLEDDDEWKKCLLEAATVRGGAQLRQLFALILTERLVLDPSGLLLSVQAELTDDLTGPTYRMTSDDANALLLLDIELRLRQTDPKATLKDYCLPAVDDATASRVRALASGLPASVTRVVADGATKGLSVDFAELFAYTVADEEATYAKNRAVVNDEQKGFLDKVEGALTAGASAEKKDRVDRLFYLDGPAGTGKSFIFQTLLCYERKEGRLPIATASTGIASTLLALGRTVHSRFKVPLHITAESICNIGKQTPLATLLRDARVRLLIIDEAPMLHKHVFECLDRTLQDLRSSSEPFGGLVVICAGDFRQCLPVVPKGSVGDILRACLFSSSLWPKFDINSLRVNMRLRRMVAGLEPNAVQDIEDFAAYLLRIGDGAEQVVGAGDDVVSIPLFLRSRAMLDAKAPAEGETPKITPDMLLSFVNEVFPSLAAEMADCKEKNDYAWLMKRAILTPLNVDVDRMNADVVETLNLPVAAMREYTSVDAVAEDDQSFLYPVEFLNSLRISGLPPHKVCLAVGLPIMLLRNMDPSNGHVNGSRYVITRLGDRIIEAVATTGPGAGIRRIFIPRMKLQANDNKLPFTLQRTMFPVRLAFAMTVNKAQGQSLDFVGLYLPNPVFAHGQLYVAYSRATTRDGLKVLATEATTRNVVFPQVKQQTQERAVRPVSAAVCVGDAYNSVNGGVLPSEDSDRVRIARVGDVLLCRQRAGGTVSSLAAVEDALDPAVFAQFDLPRAPVPLTEDEIQALLRIAADEPSDCALADLLRCCQSQLSFELSPSRYADGFGDCEDIADGVEQGNNVSDEKVDGCRASGGVGDLASDSLDIKVVPAAAPAAASFECLYMDCTRSCTSARLLAAHHRTHKETELRKDNTYIWENSDVWICSDVIRAATELHRAEFPHVGGLCDPVAPVSQRDVASIPGPQIVNVGTNHWIVAFGGAGNPEIMVFDSLSRASRVLPVRCAVTPLFHLGAEHAAEHRVVSAVCPQQQGGNDCGLFAIATQDRILRELPHDVPFDQARMRKHLANCLRAKKMTIFPFIRRSTRLRS